MSIQSASQLSFGFWQGRTVEIEQVDENISSDGGLIAFKQLDSILGWTESFSELIQHSGRNHSAKSMLQQRVFGIIAGYENQNDHDSLRSDPIFKLIADRSPSDPDLASQPTLSRFENSVTPSNLLQMEEWFLDRFVESFPEAPERITLDMDTFDDPTPGMQQLTFFHGYYDQYQYQVRVITCAENDMTVMPVLLYGTAAVSLGAYDDIVRVIQKLRARFPDTIIEFRADAGFAVPRMYESLEAIPNVIYTIGFAMSPVLRTKSDELLKSTELQYKTTGILAKQYMFFPHSLRKARGLHNQLRNRTGLESNLSTPFLDPLVFQVPSQLGKEVIGSTMLYAGKGSCSGPRALRFAFANSSVGPRI